MKLHNYTYKSDLKNDDLVLKADKNLLKLSNHKLTESDILQELKKYNLVDTLLAVGRTYAYIQSFDFDAFRVFAHRPIGSEHWLRADLLARLAHLAIKSGATKLSPKHLSANLLPNMLLLCHEISRLIEKIIPINENTLLNHVCMMDVEQLTLQQDIRHIACRNYALYTKNDFQEKFKQRIGLNLKEYFNIAIFFMAFFKRNTIFFEIDDMVKVLPKEETLFFSQKNILKIVEYLSITVEKYKELLKQEHYKNVMPLQDRPIIKLSLYGKIKYIVPSPAYFIEKVYNGVFYDIENEYEKHTDFTNELGIVFEDYVGKIIKEYSEGFTVKSGDEITYKKSGTLAKYTDWTVYNDDQAYIIEVKSAVLPLFDIYSESLSGFIKKHIIPAYKQIINNILYQNNYLELNFLKDKKQIPIIVFRNVPFINLPLFEKEIRREIKNHVDNNPKDYFIWKYLNSQKVFLFSIAEFEIFWANRTIATIEDIFDGKGSSDSVLTFLQKKSSDVKEHKIFSKMYGYLFGS